MNAVNILVVEDHDIMRFGLVQLLDGSQGLSVCEAVSNGAQAMDVLRQKPVNVIILDLSLPDCHGLNLIRNIKNRYPEKAILVHSMHEELRYGERVLAAGASGYVTKNSPPQTVIDAVRKVARGGMYISEKLQERLLTVGSRHDEGYSVSPVDVLSDRELEIFRLLGNGLSSSEIARKLQRSIKTIEAHREHIKKKLDLRHANELLRYAVCWVEEEMNVVYESRPEASRELD